MPDSIRSFSDWEWARIEAIAAGRKARNRGAKGREGATDTRGEVIGVAAEVALGLALGRSIDEVFRVVDTPAKSPGWHWTAGGLRLRVQGTDRPGHLIERVTRAKADAYVLAHVKPDTRTVNLVGWVDRPALVAAPRKTTTGPGWELTSYWVRLSDLDLMSRLWDRTMAAA